MYNVYQNKKKFHFLFSKILTSRILGTIGNSKTRSFPLLDLSMASSNIFVEIVTAPNSVTLECLS